MSICMGWETKSSRVVNLKIRLLLPQLIHKPRRFLASVFLHNFLVAQLGEEWLIWDMLAWKGWENKSSLVINLKTLLLWPQ